MSNAPTDIFGASAAPALEEATNVVPFEPAEPPEPPVYDERDRLVILTPCYGHQLTEGFAQSVLAVFAGAPSARFRLADGTVQSLPLVATLITQPGESHIDRARNTLVWQALSTHYRHFLWADADQPFEPHHIALTWTRLMNGHRVIGGSVALKTIVTTFAANLPLGNTYRDRDTDGLLEGRDTGTGWMGFKRDVIEEIIDRWPAYVRGRIFDALPPGADVAAVVETFAELGYSADLDYQSLSNSATAGQTLHAVFASGIAHRDGFRDWLSEDWMFCHRCRLLGIPVKIDPAIRIKHLGPLLFPPDPKEIIAAALQVVSGQQPPFDKGLCEAAEQVLTALRKDDADESITILHATRGRPEQALRIRALWHERAHDKNFQYIFGLDEDDAASAELAVAYERALVPPSGGVVAPLNAAARLATGRILIMAADDCEPPLHWDRQIRAALAGQLHLPRLLWTADGFTDQPVIAHPIMTRALYEANGRCFFHPDYPHLFCDTELTTRAVAAGQVIDARHIVLRHLHPMFTGEAPDALHRERNSDAAWQAGRALFQRRNPTLKHPHA